MKTADKTNEFKCPHKSAPILILSQMRYNRVICNANSTLGNASKPDKFKKTA